MTNTTSSAREYEDTDAGGIVYHAPSAPLNARSAWSLSGHDQPRLFRQKKSLCC